MKRTLVVLLTVALLGPAVAGGVTADAGPVPAQQSDGGDCEFPVSATDATGTNVTVEEEPERVVVLQASAAQTMWEIGAEEKVVGMPVQPYTAYLNGSTERTAILNADGTVDQEQVVALEPDLVLAPNAIFGGERTVESLRDAGLTVYYFRQADSLEYVYRKTRLTGRLVGACEAADRVADRTEAAVEEVRSAVAGTDRPRVLYLLGPSRYVAGTNTFIGELIEAAGGENVAGEIQGGYRRLSAETILARDPQWIVIPEGRSLPKSEAINATTAVRKGQILRVNDDFMNQPGPRVVQPLRTMAEAFHPEAVAEMGTETSTEGGAGDRAGTTGPGGTETTGDASPGYTVWTAVAAALVALAAASFRRSD